MQYFGHADCGGNIIHGFLCDQQKEVTSFKTFNVIVVLMLLNGNTLE